MMRWRLSMKFQSELMATFCRAGPFAYRDEIPSATLTAQYKLYFNWGGDAIFPQIIKDTCAQSGVAHPSRLRRHLQIVSPLTMGPEYIFHKWVWLTGSF